MEVAMKSSQQSGARKLYTHEQMRRLINPASVTIIGVSETKGSFSQRTHANMARYTGRVFQINPKYTEPP
jgi:acyl-CoA synthetase (NDP forming)